jgi:3-hydroxyisobutyrate dehydrogenase
MTAAVTVIGLGAMGGSIARRLAGSGIDTGVYDIASDAVGRLVADGAQAVDPAADDLGDFVLISLPDDRAVTAAVLESGLLERLSGRVLIELSTILPETMSLIADRAREHGVAVVDCPVSGGPAEALKGTLVLLAGAEASVLERAEPVLALLGTVEHVGPVGHGKAVKLVNNVMAMGNVAVAAEAFTLGTALGLDRERLYDVLSRSGGRSHHFQKRIPYVLAGDYSPRFSLDLGEKDLRLALQLAHDEGYVMPTASIVHQIFEMGRAKGLGREDAIAVVKIFEEWAKD